MITTCPKTNRPTRNGALCEVCRRKCEFRGGDKMREEDRVATNKIENIMIEFGEAIVRASTALRNFVKAYTEATNHARK